VQGKVANVEPSVKAIAPRESFGNVRYAIQMNVMQYNELIVLGRDDVLFEVISAHGVSEGFGLERMFRQITRRSPVGDYDWPNR
jgi:hypothetical protein